jgi:hypothetical protein
LLFALFYVLFVCKCVLPPGDNQIAVNKYIIRYPKKCCARSVSAHTLPVSLITQMSVKYI